MPSLTKVETPAKPSESRQTEGRFSSIRSKQEEPNRLEELKKKVGQVEEELKFLRTRSVSPIATRELDLTAVPVTLVNQAHNKPAESSLKTGTLLRKSLAPLQMALLSDSDHQSTRELTLGGGRSSFASVARNAIHLPKESKIMSKASGNFVHLDTFIGELQYQANAIKSQKYDVLEIRERLQAKQAEFLDLQLSLEEMTTAQQLELVE